MQKQNNDINMISKREENGFIVKSGRKSYKRRISFNANSFHNEIALGIINEDQKLKAQYEKSRYSGQPAVFLVVETPAIMIASGTSKVISYNSANVEGDERLQQEIKNYKRKGFKDFSVFF